MIFIAALLAAGAIGGTDAATAYRCIGTDGSVSFQDHPCRTGQHQRVVRLPDAPREPIVTVAPAEAVVPDLNVAATPVVVAPNIPAPDFFLCTRHDGSRYVSEDGRRGSSAVPIGMLGLPDRDLAQAYGGRNGIGISAPGVRQIPQIPAAQAPFADAYVWVDDACHHASAQEACTYLRGELEAVRDQLKRAFSDTEAQLKQQQDRLRERMRGC
ncbi:MAG: DUF4124 domain-containing protein [Dokdonella sp.]